MRIRFFWEALLVKIWWLQAWKHFSGPEVKHPPKNLPIPVTAARVVLVRLAGSTQVAIRSFIWRGKVTPWKVTFFESPCWVDQDVSPRQGKRQSQERHWKPYGNSPNRACLYIASLLFAAQFYEMPGHRHRINRVINVQVNTLFTETFPTMVNLELPNFHKWSRLIVARDTFTMIPPVYFELFAKFSQMCQVDCCWRLGCPKKTFFWNFSLNYWKTYPENTPLYHFYAKKALFKSPNFAT